MTRFAVILAAAILLLSLKSAIADTVDPPVAAKFRLADGVVIQGKLNAWDDEGFDGTFGRRLWIDLKADDVFKLRRELIDRKAAKNWIDLGRCLLQIKDGATLAERAFKQALKLDPDAAPAILAAREAATDASRRRQQADQQAASSRLRINTPEAEYWPADPWPVLSEKEQADARLALKADAAAWLTTIGLAIEPIESDYFLIFSEQTREDAARLGQQLDAAYRRAAPFLANDPEKNIFWGKAVVLLLKDPEKHRLLEATAFNQLISTRTIGICHCLGPKVILSFRMHDDPLVFTDSLMHEMTHGILHRHRSPLRLPPWANEGFAEYIATNVFKNSLVDANRRKPALAFLRSGASLPDLLSITYETPDWIGKDESTINVGYLVVNLMIREQPQRFAAWIGAVKSGKEWLKAIEEDFGSPRTQFLDAIRRHYRVND
jgi:hypothetical protein